MDYLDYLDLHIIRGPIDNHRLGNGNPFIYLSDDEFKDRFRFSKHATNELIDLITPYLQNDPRGKPCPVWQQVLCALRFFATGTLHRETGDLLNVSETSACRFVHKVASAICRLRKTYIKFPSGNNALAVKEAFYNMHRFPGILSAIDGTHIPILLPCTADKEEYRNRKGYPSINVFAATGPMLEFTNIVARWKGSTHDSRIFKNSSLYARFENEEINGILIGDSGYECNRFLMTPLTNPNTPAQLRYQKALKSTRSCVERAFGLWKNRFRCLHTENTLRFSPIRCCNIIVACAVLHNFGLLRDRWQENGDVQEGEELEMPEMQDPEVQDGGITRAQFIERHFTQH